jgi:hypothetical protein
MAYKTTTDRVAEIREELKKEFPDFKFSIRKDGYNGVRISILSAPIDLMEGETEKYVSVNTYYINEHYKDRPQAREALSKIYEIASRGVTYRETGDYGTQPSFYVWINIGSYEKPFEYKPKKGKATSTRSTSPAPSSSGTKWDRGEVIRECAGWKVYKKTLPDGRIVYNVLKDKETAANKADWDAIRGEIYTESGFKWGRFGAFEKWGEMTPNDEKLILDAMCQILTKYYAPSSTPSAPAPMPEEESEKLDIYVNGTFLEKANSQLDASLQLSAKYGSVKYNEMISSGMIVYDTSTKRLDVLEGSFFTYGKKWDVPSQFGKELMMGLIFRGFKVFMSVKTNVLIVYRTDMGADGIMISDNGGEFNVYRYGYNEFISSINYVVDDSPVSPSTLTTIITVIYQEYFSSPQQKTTSKEDLQKAINGLQILADKGNEKAKKAIIGLKILLNK